MALDVDVFSGITEAAVTSGKRQQQQLLDEARLRLQSAADTDTHSSTLSMLPTISVTAGVDDMSFKQLLQASSTSATTSNGRCRSV